MDVDQPEEPPATTVVAPVQASAAVSPTSVPMPDQPERPPVEIPTRSQVPLPAKPRSPPTAPRNYVKTPTGPQSQSQSPHPSFYSPVVPAASPSLAMNAPVTWSSKASAHNSPMVPSDRPSRAHNWNPSDLWLRREEEILKDSKDSKDGKPPKVTIKWYDLRIPQPSSPIDPMKTLTHEIDNTVCAAPFFLCAPLFSREAHSPCYSFFLACSHPFLSCSVLLRACEILQGYDPTCP